MVRSGSVGEEIQSRIKFYENGNLFDPFNVQSVNIFNVATGGSSIATLPVTRLSEGFYQATYTIPATLAPGTYYDEWTWTAEEGMASKTQRYSFEVVPADTSDGTVADAVTAHVGCRERPKWLQATGLRRIEDVGNGMGLRLQWGDAIPTDHNNQIHYNIYLGTTRFEVFDSNPAAITTAQQAVINVPPGKLRYFAVRTLEYDPTDFDITELNQIGANIFEYPESRTLQNDIDAYGVTVDVEDTNGYPNKGYIKINSEVLKYKGKDGNSFFIEDTNRGAFQTIISSHSSGATVELFTGIEDNNTLILNETAAWHEANGTPRNVDAIGEFNVGEDGYRSVNTDDITPDFTISDEENEDFPAFDFKGYRRQSIQDTLDGRCVNSYAGGEFGGLRGLNFQERNLTRLDFQLQITGEPVILLKRKWTGKRCACIGLRREHPRTRCPNCFGTGFDGGYDRYINNRPISEHYTNKDGMILARIHPYSDDLEIASDQGLRHPSELTAWTITIPTLKDRDFLIRYMRDEDTGKFIEEFRYEVLDVTRNILVLGDSGRQEFRMRRHDKTDVIYQYSINLK